MTHPPLTLEERRKAIARISALPENLDAAIRGLTDEQLDTPYRSGGWTVRQVVHHLADAHMQGFLRAKFLLTEVHPLIKPYAQDAWAATADARSGPVGASLDLLRGLHARWTALLAGVTEQDWERKAFHPERGDLTLDDMVKTYAEHGEGHIAAITALRRERNWN